MKTAAALRILVGGKEPRLLAIGLTCPAVELSSYQETLWWGIN
jgi:hypothetical protein